MIGRGPTDFYLHVCTRKRGLQTSDFLCHLRVLHHRLQAEVLSQHSTMRAISHRIARSLSVIMSLTAPQNTGTRPRGGTPIFFLPRRHRTVFGRFPCRLGPRFGADHDFRL
jgi:hypothetical protein